MHGPQGKEERPAALRSSSSQGLLRAAQHTQVSVLPSQSTTRVKPFICTMPMRLDDGWNQIQFNLSDFTRRAYGMCLASAPTQSPERARSLYRHRLARLL